jgi:hypothetical protein
MREDCQVPLGRRPERTPAAPAMSTRSRTAAVSAAEPRAIWTGLELRPGAGRHTSRPAHKVVLAGLTAPRRALGQVEDDRLRRAHRLVLERAHVRGEPRVCDPPRDFDWVSQTASRYTSSRSWSTRRPRRRARRRTRCRSTTTITSCGRRPCTCLVHVPRCAGKTGRREWMREPYSEGAANHADPESCAGRREASGEALTGACAGWVLSREIHELRGADALESRGRQHCGRRSRKTMADPARSETPCTHRTFLHGNREVPRPVTAESAAVIRKGGPQGQSLR